MSPSLRDKATAKVVSMVTRRMEKDERIVRSTLGVKPHKVPDLIILTTTVHIHKKVLKKLRSRYEKGRLVIGEYRGVEIGIVETGIGTPSATLVMEGIVRTTPSIVVRVDICGGLEDSFIIGDTFLAESAIVGDGCGSFYFGKDSKIVSDPKVSSVVSECAREIGLEFHKGTIWTTDVLFGQTIDLVKSWKQYGASAVDMETSAILGVCHREGIPATSLNCISDLPVKGEGPFDKKEVDPNLLSGLDKTVQLGLDAVVSWSELVDI